MIISPNIRLGRIINNTYKYFLFNIFTCVAAYFINEYIVRYYFEFPAIVPTILGTALAFFIGFNNNQAYGRWWEARKIWGALVNDSRTWARQLTHYTSPNDEISEAALRLMRQKLIRRHIAFLYALKENLRGSQGKSYRTFISQHESEAVEGSSNTHNAILSYQSKDLAFLYRAGVVDGFRFMALNDMIVNFCNEMGKAERIKNTVFPTTYNYYTRIFVWLFIVSVTMVVAGSIGFWSILFGTLIGYIFLTTHAIGQALLNPFEPIITGIPLDQIVRTIEINLLEMLGEPELPAPVGSVNGEYIM